MNKLMKWFKNHKLRMAIKKADRLHSFNNKKYYVFRIGKRYHVLNNDDIKLNKNLVILPNSLNAFEKLLRCDYVTK